jgi:hypothetical protein
MIRPEGMDSEVSVHRTPRSSLPRVSHLRHVAGLVGFVSTVVGTLLALGIIHPLGGTEDALAATAGTTTDAGSAKLTFTVQGPVNGRTLTLRGEGAYDFRTGRGKLTTHLPPELASFFGSSTVRTIIDGDTTYTYRPEWSAWEVSDSGAPSDGSQTELDVFVELVPDDPTQILDFLEPGADVEKVGEESSFGTETTHYRATVDVDALVDHAPAHVQETVRAAAGTLEEDNALTIDVWVDDEGLMHRLALRGQLGGVGNVAMTVDLYDFGTEVDVKVPPPSKVLDGAALGL